MMTPWWPPESSNLVLWLCSVCPLDGLLGWLASRGRYRSAVLAAWIGIMVVYGVMYARIELRKIAARDIQ
jgi:hypothetical protein